MPRCLHDYENARGFSPFRQEWMCERETITSAVTSKKVFSLPLQAIYFETTAALDVKSVWPRGFPPRQLNRKNVSTASRWKYALHSLLSITNIYSWSENAPDSSLTSDPTAITAYGKEGWANMASEVLKISSSTPCTILKKWQLSCWTSALSLGLLYTRPDLSFLL